MTMNVVKIKNGKITLPRALRDAWRSGEVLVSGDGDALLIKSLSQPTLIDLKGALRKVGKTIRRADVDAAVRWARKKAYARRT